MRFRCSSELWSEFPQNISTSSRNLALATFTVSQLILVDLICLNASSSTVLLIRLELYWTNFTVTLSNSFEIHTEASVPLALSISHLSSRTYSRSHRRYSTFFDGSLPKGKLLIALASSRSYTDESSLSLNISTLPTSSRDASSTVSTRNVVVSSTNFSLPLPMDSQLSRKCSPALSRTTSCNELWNGRPELNAKLSTSKPLLNCLIFASIRGIRNIS